MEIVAATAPTGGPSAPIRARRPLAAPTNERQARQWVRYHWADFIRNAGMGDVAALNIDAINAVWSDECQRVANKLTNAGPQRRPKL